MQSLFEQNILCILKVISTYVFNTINYSPIIQYSIQTKLFVIYFYELVIKASILDGKYIYEDKRRNHILTFYCMILMHILYTSIVLI